MRSSRGIALINFVLMIIAVLAVAFFSIYYIFYGIRNKQEIISEQEIEDVLLEQNRKEKIDTLGMDTRIINDLTDENIPIPQGYSYIRGQKSTGIIIENKYTGYQYLFIPYSEYGKKDIDQYYNKVQDIYVDIGGLELNSIKKYNGFFVEINSNIKYTDLKTIDNKNYKKLYESLQNNNDNVDSVSTHILYKEEIAQIEYYLNENNINAEELEIGIQALVVEAFSNINNISKNIENDIDKQIGMFNFENKVTKISNNKITKTVSSTNNNNNKVYYYETESSAYGGSSGQKVRIPIPSGFKYCETDGIVIIQDKSNKNMIYIWVPLKYEDLSILKSKLWNDIYKKCVNEKGKTFSTETYLYDMLVSSKDDRKSKFDSSIEKYNGFYVSQAELSKNKKNQFVNTSRGMVDYSVIDTIEGGDYIRGWNATNDVYDYMNRIAIESNQKESVISHLMYGVEYDAILLWIANTNQNYIDDKGLNIYKVLCDDSTNVGKYSNSTHLGANANASEIEYFNFIWGLGGNLAELTQEKYHGSYLLRGGSYSDTGQNLPIASRAEGKDLKKENVGIRTALYLPENLTNGGSVNQDDTTFGYVAKINNKNYKTLQQAIDEAPDNIETTISLIANTNENILIPENKYIILDLNNCILESTNNIETIINKGRFILKGEGNIKSLLYCTIHNFGKMAIWNNANIQLTSNEQWCALSNEGDFIIRGKLFNLPTTNLVKNYGNIKLQGGELTNIGVQLSEYCPLLYNHIGATLNIEEGIIGGISSIKNNKGKILGKENAIIKGSIKEVK